MQTNIEIDESVIRQIQQLTGLKTEREIVARALAYMLKTAREAEIKQCFGKLRWEGNLDEHR